jgi:hypothetical protein
VPAWPRRSKTSPTISIVHFPTRTGCAARSSSCLVFAGSAQNPVDVIRELGRIQRRPFPAEAEALTADYEGGAAL